MIRQVGHHVDSATAVVIFPEGRLFRPDRLERATARLALENPERAARLESLGPVLPPRPGGVLALLGSIPADVVVISHRGLDRFALFTDLAKAVPLRDPIRVTAWRIPVDQIPTGDAERVTWLDEQWVLVNEHVAQAVCTPTRAPQPSPTHKPETFSQ